MDSGTYSFDVALSFAGEDRQYVEEVPKVLRSMGFRVFYDKYETVSLWGKNLYTHLSEVYLQLARYVVVFISKHYKEKLWTNHERESAQARAFMEKREYILPARFDDTQIPGVLPTVGYIGLAGYSPRQFAELVKQKIGPIVRAEFFPETPDRLFKHFGKLSKSRRGILLHLAESFFDVLKLMTPQERFILAMASAHACPAGLPENVHQRLDYLSRIASMSREELLSLFTRLDCLQIKSRLYVAKDHQDEYSLAGPAEIIEIKYQPHFGSQDKDATLTMVAIFDCISNYLCDSCSRLALECVDLSVLSSVTATAELHHRTDF
jgi:TIR domain